MRLCLAAMLASLAAAPAAAQQPAAGPACKPTKNETFACRLDNRELRVIKGSVSPSGRYAIAWEPGDEEAKRRVDEDESGNKSAVSLHIANMLISLPDGKVVAPLAGDHYGDLTNLNHHQRYAYWSSDSRYLVTIDNQRYETPVVDAIYFRDDGSILGPLSLVAFFKETLGREFKRRRLKGDPKKFVYQIDAESVGTDGTVIANGDLGLFKTEYFDFDLRLRLVPGKTGLTAKLVSVKIKS